jgi:hypothetical protein
MRGFDILVSETRSRTIYDLESETRDRASHSHAGPPEACAAGRLRDGLHGGVWLGLRRIRRLCRRRSVWAGVLDLPGGEQAARRLMAFGLAASAPAALGRRRRLVSAA